MHPPSDPGKPPASQPAGQSAGQPASQSAPGTYAPDAAEIERLAEAAIARLPDTFRVHLANVVLKVEDFADEETLAHFDMDNPFELTGLYSGRPVGDQSSMLSGELPARIHLYRRPLLDEWAETGVSLEDLVTHVLIHEAGHHFGFSDEEMHALEESVRDGPEADIGSTAA